MTFFTSTIFWVFSLAGLAKAPVVKVEHGVTSHANVTCLGAVNLPGQVEVSEPIQLGDLVGRCHGLTPSAADTGRIYIRRSKELNVVGPWVAKWRDTWIDPGDFVFIPFKPISNLILGEVWSGSRVYWDAQDVITADNGSGLTYGTDTIDHPCVLQWILTNPARALQTWALPLSSHGRLGSVQAGAIFLIPPHQGGGWAEPVHLVGKGVAPTVMVARRVRAKEVPTSVIPKMPPNSTSLNRDDVVILGEVVRPGPIGQIGSARLADYIAAAGGLTPQADSRIIVFSPDKTPIEYTRPAEIRELQIEKGCTVVVLRTSQLPFAVVMGDVGGEPLVLGGQRLPGDDLLAPAPGTPPLTIHEALVRNDVLLPSMISALLVVHRIATAEMSVELMHEAAFRSTPIAAGDLVIVPSAKDVDGLRTQLASFQRQIPKIVQELRARQ